MDLILRQRYPSSAQIIETALYKCITLIHSQTLRNVDSKIGINANQVRIISGMMQVRQAKTILHHRFPAFSMRNYVRGNNQFRASNTCQGALFAVCPQYIFPELCLVRSYP